MEGKTMKNKGYSKKVQELREKYKDRPDDELKDAIEMLYRDTLKSVKERWARIKIGDMWTPYRVSNTGKITEDTKYDDKVPLDLHATEKSRYVYLSMSNGIYIGVHRLVGMYFCKIPARHRKDGLTFKTLVINHKDGVKTHNASFNLEWVTHKENSDHAWISGLNDGYKGENSHMAKISESTARQIIKLIMDRKTNSQIQNIIGCEKVTLKTIQHIRAKECWKHLTKDLEFPKLLDVKPFSITDDTVHNICKDLENNKKKGMHESDSTIAMRYGVHREIVRDIRLRKKRTSISKNYDF